MTEVDEVDKENLKLFTRSSASLLLTEVSNCLAKLGVRAYLVGGFVRDVLLGRDTADIDIAVAADALEIAPEVATALSGKYVMLDKVNRVGRVILGRGLWVIDFSTFKESIEQDLARRDFTINAMAINLKELTNAPTDIQLIDPSNGWGDLQQGIIRVVTGTAFELDAARLLRAVRLAAELGFSIDNETEGLIRRHCHLIASVAGERIREELLRLLSVPDAGRLLFHLDRLGLLTAAIPEMAGLKGVEQPKEHFWDVFDHSIRTVVATDFLLRQGDWEYTSNRALVVVPWSAELARHFDQGVSSGSTRRALLKLAALLHDIAKPQTKAIDARGRMRFLEHAQQGAAKAVNILGRLRFSTKEVKLVETMIKHHLRPGQLSQEGLPSHRAIYRFFRDGTEAATDILFLSMADHLATRGPHLNLTQWQQHAQMVEYVLAQREQEKNLVKPPKLVDGHDLINILGMSPGPKLGQLLESVREAQAAGEVTTREEALSYIRGRLLTNVSGNRYA